MMIDLEQFLAESGIDGVVLERWYAREWIVAGRGVLAPVDASGRNPSASGASRAASGSGAAHAASGSNDAHAADDAAARIGEPRGEISDVDAARALFIRDLQGDFGVNDEGIDLVLHLVDQVHGLRRALAVLRDEFGTPRG
jgi:hypothetical protein